MKNLNLYLCGPTVYDQQHIGNFRPVIFFDVLIRFLELKHQVNYLSNITDIDDKIINRAAEQNCLEEEISKQFSQQYFELIKLLNIKTQVFYKVTEHIDDIIEFILKLIDKGFTYQIGKDLYFDTTKLANYNKSLNLISENLLFNVNEKNFKKKHNPQDFILWKTETLGKKFSSPFGAGRPGWHTECAAFVYKYFNGKQLAFHGGGIDLRFPHHLNESAQFEALTGKPITKKWIHIGQVNFENQKMSKSLGNIIYMNDFLQEHSPNSLRLLFLSTFYTKPINYSRQLIEQVEIDLNKYRNALLRGLLLHDELKLKIVDLDKNINKIFAIEFDTPKIIDYLHQIIKKINNLTDKLTLSGEVNNLYSILLFLGFTITINYQKATEFSKFYREKNYQISDQLRKEIIIL